MPPAASTRYAAVSKPCTTPRSLSHPALPTPPAHLFNTHPLALYIPVSYLTPAQQAGDMEKCRAFKITGWRAASSCGENYCFAEIILSSGESRFMIDHVCGSSASRLGLPSDPACSGGAAVHLEYHYRRHARASLRLQAWLGKQLHPLPVLLPKAALLQGQQRL